VDDIDVRFTYHKPPDERTEQAHAEMRRRCKAVARWLEQITPPSDERDQAIDHLDYAMTRGNAAIARRGLS
jgi:hypothetical protein